jgi:DNA-binding transcriptional regulator YiaG
MYIRPMMTGTELRTIRKSLRLSQEKFGQLVDCGRVAVSDWEREINCIPGLVEAVSRMLDDYPERLFELERYRGLRQARPKVEEMSDVHETI